MLQVLQIFAKFQKFQLDCLVDFENAAKRVSCKDRRRYSRKRAKCCRNFAKNWQLPYGSPPRALPGREGVRGEGGAVLVVRAAAQRRVLREPVVILTFFSNFRLMFGKFREARSRLYRGRCLQGNSKYSLESS